MQVRRKIWLIPSFSAVIIIIFVISMTIVFNSSQTVSSEVKLAKQIYLPVIQEVFNISSNIEAIQGVFEKVVMLNDRELLEQTTEFAAKISESIKKLDVYSGYISGIENFRQTFKKYYDISSSLSKDMTYKNLSELSVEIAQASLLRTQLEYQLHELKKMAERGLSERFLKSQQKLNNVTWTVMILIGLLVLISGGGAYIVMRNLSYRMNRMLAFAKEVEFGNYDCTIKENWNDEFSVLSRALNAMATSIKQSTEKLSILANTDSLTEIYNRHALLQRLNEELHAVRRHGYHLCLCMCDIDKFKTVNDTHGHLVGDKVIKAFANCVREGLRIEDIVGRYGGDEFCIILPHTSVENARIAVDRIRQNWSKRDFVNDQNETFSVTGSFGIAEYHPTLGMDEFVKLADEALYQSKEAGRNTVSIISNKRT